ncbi:MAG: hypothetical protein EBU75_08235 [Betaproteobacteria bacterium]|nr:hypothetical protein [Betaproteobacteria bacterium]
MGAQSPAPDNRAVNSASSTSLKWGSDGELSAVDLARILERLSDGSQATAPLTECTLPSAADHAGLD